VEVKVNFQKTAVKNRKSVCWIKEQILNSKGAKIAKHLLSLKMNTITRRVERFAESQTAS